MAVPSTVCSFVFCFQFFTSDFLLLPSPFHGFICLHCMIENNFSVAIEPCIELVFHFYCCELMSTAFWFNGLLTISGALFNSFLLKRKTKEIPRTNTPHTQDFSYQSGRTNLLSFTRLA
jgi:hypothetical protein